MASSEGLIERRKAVTPRGIPMVTNAVVESASGALLTDPEGRELIDFAGGIGVMNAGHCPPSVVAAICEQASKLLHTCFHIATYEPYIALCEKLIEILPHGDQTKAMLVNSGAEAVENAVKIARQATNRSAVICYTGGFHGRTLMAMSLTSKYGYKIGCGPYAPEVYRLPFPNYYHSSEGQNETAFVEQELCRFRESLVDSVAAEQVAAVIMEPVQGEGGFVPVPKAYLQGLRRICDETGILLILDEVQSGFCRTGGWSAFEHYGVVPDMSTWAKSMGGGLPIGAVIGKAEIMDAARLGTIGGTYGGNPVACAAALASIKLMGELKLGTRATVIGNRVVECFRKLQRKHPEWIGDVRGLGAMVAIEFVVKRNPHDPATELTAEILKGCSDRQLLILGAGIYSNVLRFLAPLVITDEQLERGLTILSEEVASAIERRS
jgi:4-aminobutyrate aminotransferase / (S)-3-amino-2-methylpropionate transaminase / 5-aminovalerate transaminase